MDQDKVLRSFSGFLGQHASGQINNELTEAMREMIAGLSNMAIENGGKQKGKIVVTVDVVLDQGTFDVLVRHKETTPKPPAAKSVYWATEGNQLSIANPKQPDLPFRTAALEKEDTRTVG